MQNVRLKDFVEIWNFYAKKSMTEEDAADIIQSAMGNQETFRYFLLADNIKDQFRKEDICFYFRLVFDDGKRFIEFKGHD